MWYEAEYETPVRQTVERRTGNKRVCTEVRLGEWAWTLTDAEAFDAQQIEKEILPIGGLFLPLRIERTVLWETVKENVSIHEETLRTEASARALELARGKLPEGAKETGCWVDWNEMDGILTARATIEAEMDIAAERGEPFDS